MRSSRLLVFVIPFLCAVLVACGKKGPLYLPQPPAQPGPAVPAQP